MVVLGARGLTRRYGHRTLLENLSVSIEQGERVGLVGRNGAGKSTLGRILAGVEPPDAGELVLQKGASVGYLPQVPRLPDDQSPRAIVLEGMGAWMQAQRRHQEASDAIARGDGELQGLLAEQAKAAEAIERLGGWDRAHEADSVLGHLGVERIDDPVGSMSGGEQRRVALARLLVSRPTLAIFDEPTNHLDVETIEWLQEYLISSMSGACLLITHDRALLDAVVQRTLELDEGLLHAYAGGFAAYLEGKALRLEHARRTESNRQNYLRTELEWLRRSPKARTTKSKARIQRVQAAMDASVKTQDKTAVLEATTTRTGHTILEAEGLRLQMGDKLLVDGLDLRLSHGDVLGIIGRNGAGKTTLLRALLGEIEPSAGTVRRGQNTKVAYLDQTRAGLDENATVLQAVAGDRMQLQIGGTSMSAGSWLERFLFDGTAARQKIGSLSGGERARVALAKLLAEPANLLVLDEPTNDLDVDTLAALETLLEEYAGTALVVTHDRRFLDRVATAILAFEGDGTVHRVEGNYADYRASKAANRKAALEPEPSQSQPAASQSEPKTRRGLTYAERLELQRIEGDIETAEQAVADLEAELGDPATYEQGPSKARELDTRLSTAKDRLDTLMARWEELESKKDG